MFINRHLLEAGLAAAAVCVSVMATAPAQAQLPAAGLAPDQFSTDLGFDNLKSLNITKPSTSLEELKKLINNEANALSQGFLAQYELDTSKLFWNGVDPVEVYFINEGAGYRNQLFYTATNASGGLTSSGKIFDDISSRDSKLSESNGPLALGQGVSLGAFVGATQLDFMIKSNGKNGGNTMLGTNAAANPNGLQHVVAFQHQDWIILGFEDIVGGGDRDYNDVIFAVRGIQHGAPPAEDVPEPSALLGIAALGIGGFTTLRRRKATVA
ncbi:MULTISPECIES: DUF4114 domain-containing protein [Cyanophyceae]|uniref:DUF4114 domain-containing protein n=1 Tax=Cyanophyceae TaxID=3028117 RepID=UPI0016895609|nr:MULTISPECIES: DUF4114 domain-containing protein [Cyanophyceae]MBD1915547.1 DUF4114 domain-containing protein [Phormidium sp. FACHB-77]MBD2031857.1 DUF4114 domain-containing protein [Phormidium sp. FACHB-322]MBD2050607.1 DUF4114 domain-containing protein [Leptolyngbya sp. FACHB-60]